MALAFDVPALAGALFGAGATLLGGWINEWNSRRIQVNDQQRRQLEDRRYLAPELSRVIGRVVYILGRATVNYSCASSENEAMPTDLKEDFLPFWPVLYPNAPQLRDLSGDDALALIEFYDSLHSISESVNNWWERDGQLRANIFNVVMHNAQASLKHARTCMENFEIEKLYPPPYAAWPTLSQRIASSLLNAEQARNLHIAWFEAKKAAEEAAKSQSKVGRRP